MAVTRITGVKGLDKISNNIIYCIPHVEFRTGLNPLFSILSMYHTLKKVNTMLSQMDRQRHASFPPLETAHPIVYMATPRAAADGKRRQDSHKLTARLILEVIVSSSFPRVYRGRTGATSPRRQRDSDRRFSPKSCSTTPAVSTSVVA